MSIQTPRATRAKEQPSAWKVQYEKIRALEARVKELELAVRTIGQENATWRSRAEKAEAELAEWRKCWGGYDKDAMYPIQKRAAGRESGVESVKSASSHGDGAGVPSGTATDRPAAAKPTARPLGDGTCSFEPHWFLVGGELDVCAVCGSHLDDHHDLPSDCDPDDEREGAG